MADRGLYLLDVTIKPGPYVKDAIDGSWTHLMASSSSNEKVVYGFKVVGENRLIVVRNGGTEAAVTSLVTAYGEQVEVKCIPLRTYEGFAKNVLGVEDETLTQPSQHHLGSDGIIFLLHFTVEYRGFTATELLQMWRREAEKVLGLRSSGALQIDVYKVVAQREVYGFIKASDAEIMDDMSFTLPILKESGDQIHINTKVLIPLSTS